MTAGKHIILAAGGTGGHIFPAEALAEELTQRGHTVSMITDKRFSDYSAGSMKGILGQVPIYHIPAGTFGHSLWQRFRGVCNIGLGIWHARRILGRVKPDAVVGFGGYPSFPTMMAATGKHVPAIIHEQNALLGKANRALAGRVTRIATSFPETGLMKKENQHKVKLVGNPTRSAIRALREVPYPELTEDGVMRILVLGGSQGASIFSQVVPQAIALLPENLRQRLRMDQQTRQPDMEMTRRLYDEIKVNADLSPFFTDVPARMASAHLIISRSGASTIAELTCAGRPSILVPYPQATDDHQTANANAVEEVGGAWLMPQDAFTPEALAARLESFLTLPASLARAAKEAHQFGRQRAASDLADLVFEEIARYERGERFKLPTAPRPDDIAHEKGIAA